MEAYSLLCERERYVPELDRHVYGQERGVGPGQCHGILGNSKA